MALQSISEEKIHITGNPFFDLSTQLRNNQNNIEIERLKLVLFGPNPRKKFFLWIITQKMQNCQNQQ